MWAKNPLSMGMPRGTVALTEMKKAKDSSDSTSSTRAKSGDSGALAALVDEVGRKGDEAGKERLHAACIAIARRLRQARHDEATKQGGNWRIGLFPAAKQISILPVALVLAGALEELTGEHVAVVGGIWAGQSARSALGEDKPFFVEASLGRRVSLFASEAKAPPGGASAFLKELLERTGDRGFGFCLLDLTGLSRMGEHLEVADSLDEVVLVAAAGKTREHDLLVLNEELGLAQGARIGVLLTGETR